MCATVIPKPGVSLSQEFEAPVVRENTFLPTLVIGERYDINTDSSLGSYDGNDLDEKEYDYPNLNATSIVDQSSAKLKFKEIELKYYDSVLEGSNWRKIGSSPNKLRTILASNLIFKTDNNSLFPNSAIFKDRGVKVGDKIKIDSGAFVTETTVKGFEADKSISTVSAITNNAGNQVAQSNSIAAAVAGSLNGDATLASNTGGTYAGSLEDNVLTDTYIIRISQTGKAPVNSVLSNNTASDTVATVTSIYDFSAPETYTIRILTGGALGVATAVIESQSGTDNTPAFTTAASGVPFTLNSKSTDATLTGTTPLTAGDTFVIQCNPSQGRLSITTASGTDQQVNKVFPGFGVAIPTGVRGVEVTITAGASTEITAGDSWSVAVVKAIDAVVATSTGTFTGPQDINYTLEVIQGGGVNKASLRVSSTYLDTNRIITLVGFGSGNLLNVGDYGLQVYFDTNTQLGLVKGDKFNVTAQASVETALKTIITDARIPDEADNETIGAAVYTGGGTPNTATSGGDYLHINKALSLYSTEVYTITVVTGGAYGTAELVWTSSSGLDNSTSNTLIPVTPGTDINIGTQGLTVNFTGANPFTTSDSWTITISKPNLSVKLLIPVAEKDISQQREDNPLTTAWSVTASKISISAGLCFKDSSWDDFECLLAEKATMFFSYRALHTLNANTIFTIEDEAISSIESILGKDSQDNPIARGARLAILNNTSTAVYAIYPNNSTLTAWTDLFAKLEAKNETNTYRLAILTNDDSKIDAAISHLNKMSSPQKNKWRDLYTSKEMPKVFDVVGTSTSSDVTATVIENINDPGKFNVVRASSGNFGVSAVGDKLVYLNNTYTITKADTNSEIEIDGDLGAPQTIPASVYIYHEPTAQEVAEQYLFFGENFNSRRIVHVVPDTFKWNGESHPSYFAAAAIAGYKGGLPVHQPITNTNIIGIDEVEDSLRLFNDTQLDLIASGGNLILAQDSDNESPYIRHQLTTDDTDVNKREISVTENIDEISYGITGIIKPFIGKYNIHTGVIDQVKTNVEGYLYTKTESVNDQAGPQLTSFENLSIEQDTTQVDKINVSVRLIPPKPFNYADITLTVTN